ncbi:ATP-binding protein [Maribacter sp. 2307ULW6-5]|uniref:ATP-binding protein n=1 Tax=Maribacter sp. 2307ULW6-5 TaxID=3386275 RepID=UPI0039BC92B6
MELTDNKRAKVLDTYTSWLASYFSGDVATDHHCFNDAQHFKGDYDNNEFLDRKAVTNLLEATAGQFAGKYQLKNEKKTVEAFGNLVLITHVFDAWFLQGSAWTYFRRFRFKSVLQEKKAGWCFIHQHFSTTGNSNTEETIGLDKVHLENQKLRKAIKRTTFELEAKNRELEVEGALERIRTEATAMKKSSNLFDVVVLMRKEFLSLGHQADYFWHMSWEKESYNMSMTSHDGSRVGMVITVPKFVHDTIIPLANWEKSRAPTFVLALNAKEAWDYLEQMNTYGHYQQADPHAPTQKDIEEIGGLTFIMARTSHGEIGYSLPGVVYHPPTEDLHILERFASVFDLAHRRFLDLQKVEKQSREVEIELAIERIRSRTMAMQHSAELQETSALLDAQVRALGIETWGCAFNIYGENDSSEWFSSQAGIIPPYKTPRENIFLTYYNLGQEENTLHIEEFKGKKCIEHYDYLCTLPEAGEALRAIKKAGGSFPKYQIDHVAYFKQGYLLFITLNPVPEAHDIFKRFAKVFEQTYTRFLDLQKAEAQAREAQIEAALEKVRSRSLAMHNPEELQEVVAVVAKTLKELGVIFNAGGVILCTYFPDNKDVVHWISVDDFSTSGRYCVPYFDTPIFNDAWDSKMRGDAYFSKSFPVAAKNEFFALAFAHSDYRQMPEDYKQFVLQADSHNLSAAWSKNSAIIIPSLNGTVPSESDAKILIRFAKVFEQAYIRFLDLKKAEEQTLLAEQNLIKLKTQKQRAEEALSELQQTQKQLIQSEKMASLGELTAGIAHEIQNPLNFVNNFSEVSKELLEEMLEEMANGELEEVKAIATDISQNLEKINHHGKRADGIVKGMLQHSRTSSGAKEPTDINALADEYLRLAYHGLRAKDKSFNAVLVTDYDETIGKINVIPQDMGRVILNLISNAFYASNERKQASKDKAFEPTVSVSTKKQKDKIEICVKDNGKGIPAAIVDKIFQPFFTTKPTGQGTGLGLSMSYDIVTKGHCGELKVETNQAVGTAFIIYLPIQNNVNAVAIKPPQT